MRTLTEFVESVRSGEVSSSQLVSSSLEAIADVQARCNAFTHVLADDALSRARELDERPNSGPLHGVPVAIKELFDVAGVPSTGCCAAYADRVASSDSAVVARLRAAGAVVVAKTNQHELACGTTTQVSSFGGARNPWDTSRVPGGSSGGSGIAVATGVVPMAMGSDTGGSIRIPASCCGVTGLKPTNGAISMHGAMPLARTFDCAGPLAVTADDCLLVFRVLAGHDNEDPYSRPRPRPAGVVPPTAEVRVAVPDTFLVGVEPEVLQVVDEAAGTLGTLGIRVERIAGPVLDDAFVAFGRVLAPEFAADHRSIADDPAVTDFIRARLTAGRQALVVDYLDALALRHRFIQTMSASMHGFHALLAPVQLFTPLPIDGVAVDPAAPGGGRPSSTRLCSPANVAGLPALALPAGFSSDGLPVGVQLIGHAWTEELLCAVGSAFQGETDWHTRTAPR